MADQEKVLRATQDAEKAGDYATVSGAKVHRSEFAYAPAGSKPSEWKLPIHDAAHVRNALARWNQTDLPAAAKAGVFAKIKAAAKRFGVEVAQTSASEASTVLSLPERSRREVCGSSSSRTADLKGSRSALPTAQRSAEVRILSEVRNGLVKIAVAYTGDYERDGKGFSITSRDLEEMATNLGEREVPIDYEHLSAQSGVTVPPGWARAAGWIRRPGRIADFRLPILDSENPKSQIPNRKLLWAWAELTPACLAMIKQKEYRYFSPEIHWRDVDERGKRIGTRLAAGAMTNRPFLKNLPPIELSDADYNALFGLDSRLRGNDGRPLLAMVALSESGQSKIEIRNSKIALMDLDSVHVPGASKQISIAYHQPESGVGPTPAEGLRPAGGSRESGAGQKADSSSRQVGTRNDKGRQETMAKKFSFRKLTEGEHAGKFGLYKSDELMMDEGEPVVFDDEDFPQSAAANGNGEDAAAPRSDDAACDGEGDGEACPERSRRDAAAPGGEALPASGQAPVTAREARALAEMFRDGRVDLGRASALAAQGRLAVAAVFRAQAAEKLVDQFIAEGKLLPKRRGAAFRLALEDEAGLRALLSDARPMVDFRSWGLAGAAHLTGSAQTELDEMVRQWIAEHNTDYSAALSEITRRNPELWQRASAEVSERARAGEDEME